MVGVSLPRPSVGWPFFFRLLSASQILLKRAKVEASLDFHSKGRANGVPAGPRWQREGFARAQRISLLVTPT